jgi:hypothetical protein
VLTLVVALPDRASARAPGRARLVAIGALFGLTLLVRPVSAVMAPAFLVLWWGAGVRAALWRLALVGVACVAVLVPWSVRSSLAMDAPVALSLNVGDNLCLGHNPGSDGGFGGLDTFGEACFAGEGLRRPELETRRQSENIDRALTYVREHPGETLRRTPSKARITLQDDHDGLDAASDYGARPVVSSANVDRLAQTSDVFYYLVAAAAVVGGVVWLRRPDPARRGLFLVVAGLAQLVLPLATFGDPRFKMPLYPTLAICAAVAVAALWDVWSPARGEAAGPAALPGVDEPADGQRLRGSTGASRPVPRGAMPGVSSEVSAGPSS